MSAVLTGPATFTVSNTNDSGAGSLRQAMLNANASVGTFDTITFSIPGPAPFSIALQSALPVITDRVTIDGTTQPGYSGKSVDRTERRFGRAGRPTASD